LLALLAEDYDRRHALPPDKSTPTQKLQFLMEHSGKTAADLQSVFGSRSHVHEALTGKRGISAPQARKLGSLFGVSPGCSCSTTGAQYSGYREVGAAPLLTKDREIELSQHMLANDQQAEFAAKTLIRSEPRHGGFYRAGFLPPEHPHLGSPATGQRRTAVCTQVLSGPPT
jgi:hypothetical protein